MIEVKYNQKANKKKQKQQQHKLHEFTVNIARAIFYKKTYYGVIQQQCLEGRISTYNSLVSYFLRISCTKIIVIFQTVAKILRGILIWARLGHPVEIRMTTDMPGSMTHFSPNSPKPSISDDTDGISKHITSHHIFV